MLSLLCLHEGDTSHNVYYQSDVPHEIYRPTPRRAEPPRLNLSPSRGPLPLLPTTRSSPLVTDTGYISLSSGRKSTSPPSRATPVRGKVTPSPASPALTGDMSFTKLEINSREDNAEI